jgi:hypothetical protein
VELREFPHDVKNALQLCDLKDWRSAGNKENLFKGINQHISDHVGQSQIR